MSVLGELDNDIADLLERVRACSGSEELSEWEDDEFLPSIHVRLMKNRHLTDRQLEIFERIEYKVQFGIEAYWEEYGEGS
jgi:hypothetical protein